MPVKGRCLVAGLALVLVLTAEVGASGIAQQWPLQPTPIMNFAAGRFGVECFDAASISGTGHILIGTDGLPDNLTVGRILPGLAEPAGVWRVELPRGHGPEACGFLDHDLDGDLDIHVTLFETSDGANGVTKLLVFLAQVEGQWPSSPSTEVALEDEAGFGLAFADHDGDGILDLATAGYGSRAHIRRGLGGGSYSAEAVWSNPDDEDNSAVPGEFLDLNDDGRADYVDVTPERISIWSADAIANGGEPEWVLDKNSSSTWIDATMWDATGDGHADLVTKTRDEWRSEDCSLAVHAWLAPFKYSEEPSLCHPLSPFSSLTIPGPDGPELLAYSRSRVYVLEPGDFDAGTTQLSWSGPDLLPQNYSDSDSGFINPIPGVLATDFTGDGVTDFLVALWGNTDILILVAPTLDQDGDGIHDDFDLCKATDVARLAADERVDRIGCAPWEEPPKESAGLLPWVITGSAGLLLAVGLGLWRFGLPRRMHEADP